MNTTNTEQMIAVVGMACRFPEAESLDEYWQLLIRGGKAMKAVDPDILRNGPHADFYERDDYVPVECALRNIREFDHQYFNCSPREAAMLDPQQRLLMSACVQALENGAQPRGDSASHTTAAYASVSQPTYMMINLLPRVISGEIDYLEMMLANDKDYAASRVAYKLNLCGPALTIQSACSSSLAAVHTAVQSLLAGECDTAVVASATTVAPTPIGYIYIENGMRSPDGLCRPFDESAKGTVFGSGAAAVVLKRLDDAQADRDHIWGLICGSAINNDGASKVGFTAPNSSAQASVILEAMEVAGLTPNQMSFVEGHGTATPLGDPVEVSALHQAYKALELRDSCDEKPSSTWLGSVKGNIGHLDATAGLAGFIKAILSVNKGIFPGTVNFKKLNPGLSGMMDYFEVSSQTQTLTESPKDRFGGVSAFGLGGTNVHVVVQGWENQEAPRLDQEGRWQHKFILSAIDSKALDEMEQTILKQLQDTPKDAKDIQFTLASGVASYSNRRILTVKRDAKNIVSLVDRSLINKIQQKKATAFLFPGQGVQFPQMGNELYAKNELFRNKLDNNSRLIVEAGGPNVIKLLSACWAGDEDAASELNRTIVTQPVLFAMEQALASLMMENGIVPDMLLGHSLGEYTAACLAGVFNLEHACRLVVARATAMQNAPEGRMLAVLGDRDSITKQLKESDPSIVLAVVNGKTNHVLSGPVEHIAQCEARLMKAGIHCVYLRGSSAFHTPALDSVLDNFHSIAQGIPMQEPRIPIISNLTGEFAGREVATADYWLQQTRSCVQFAKGLHTLFEQPCVALEVGPGKTLSDLANWELGNAATTVPLIPPLSAPSGTEINESHDPRQLVEETACNLWFAGAEVSWDRVLSSPDLRKKPMFWTQLRPSEHWYDRLNNGTAPHSPAQQSMIDAPIHKTVPQSQAFSETDVETTLRTIWQRLLLVPQIATDESFIELGGDSVLALQMIRQANEAGLNFSVKDVFECKTISILASRIMEQSPLPPQQGINSSKEADDCVSDEDMQSLFTMLGGD